jgi:deoxyribose-phosphate aldolase
MRLNKYIEHALVRPDATRAQIEKVCAEGAAYQFASVCVNACWTKLAYELLNKSGVNICVTIGFPLGATTTLVKIFEADQAIDAGADEVDMVMNVGALKSGLHEFVRDDIAGVARACQRVKQPKALLTVIVETALLTDAEKRIACQLAREAGAGFVKTSAGFNGSATVEDIRLMRATAGPDVGVKASGGVHTYGQALAMIQAGATRIGACDGVALMKTCPHNDC